MPTLGVGLGLTTMRLLLLLVLFVACGPGTGPSSTTNLAPPDLVADDVYVWRRRISNDMRAAMVEVAPAVGRFKVLAREHEGTARREVWIDWQASDFPTGRAVTLVWRIDGTTPLDGLSVTPLLARAIALKDAGVVVGGVEVDHDCPTRALGAYAAWLQQVRTETVIADPAFSLGITALPTWATAPAALTTLAQSVDGITLQLHAVAAPVLFDVDAAGRDLDAFAAALPPSTVARLRIALPTYRVTLATGAGVSATADDVHHFRQQHRWPRISWFRLGADDDRDAWGPATLAAAIAGEGSGSGGITVMLRDTDDEALKDVVVKNVGAVDRDAPAVIVVDGVVRGDGSRGFGVDVANAVEGATGRRWSLRHRAPPRLRPGDEIVVGWVRGSPVLVFDGVHQ